MVPRLHPLAEDSHHDDHIVCFWNILRKWSSFLHAGQMSSIIERYKPIWLPWSSWFEHIKLHLPSHAIAAGMGRSPRCTDANIDWTSTGYGNKAPTPIFILSHDCIHLVHWHAWIGLITNSCRWCAVRGACRNWNNKKKTRSLRHDRQDESGPCVVTDRTKTIYASVDLHNVNPTCPNLCLHFASSMAISEYCTRSAKCIAVCACQQSTCAYIAVVAISKKHKVKFWPWTQHAFSANLKPDFICLHQAPRSNKHS